MEERKTPEMLVTVGPQHMPLVVQQSFAKDQASHMSFIVFPKGHVAKPGKSFAEPNSALANGVVMHLAAKEGRKEATASFRPPAPLVHSLRPIATYHEAYLFKAVATEFPLAKAVLAVTAPPLKVAVSFTEPSGFPCHWLANQEASSFILG